MRVGEVGTCGIRARRRLAPWRLDGQRRPAEWLRGPCLATSKMVHGRLDRPGRPAKWAALRRPAAARLGGPLLGDLRFAMQQGVGTATLSTIRRFFAFGHPAKRRLVV